jgi:hypothetical protein
MSCPVGLVTAPPEPELAASLPMDDNILLHWRKKQYSTEDEMKKEQEEEEEQQKIVAAVETNALMYICADKLELDDLRKHAPSKFKKRLESVTDANYAYPAVRLVYENIYQNNSSIRHAVTRCCIHYHQRMSIFPKFVALLEQHEGNAWVLAMELQSERAKSKRAKSKRAKSKSVNVSRKKERAKKLTLHA